jgi:archaemetzincin
MPSKVLQMVAVGSAPASLLKDFEEPLLAQLQLPSKPSKSPLTAPSYAFNKDRNQYHSNAIMRRLVPLLEPQGLILGLVDVDLFVPDSPFVFGEADRESRSAVLSIQRLRTGPDDHVFRRRAQVEAVHQAGHLVGLSYCEDSRCVMFLAQSVHDVDKKQPSLCHVCRNELAKINR